MMMEHNKIMNLSDNTANQPPNWEQKNRLK